MKSGKDYKLHRAMDNIRNVKEWTFEDSIVLCGGNIEVCDGVTYLPWYLFFLVRPKELPKNMTYQVDLTALDELSAQ